MANTTELDNRLKIVENIILNAVILPTSLLKWDDTAVVSGSKVYGQDASLFGNDQFFADVSTAPPTLEGHFTNVFRY